MTPEFSDFDGTDSTRIEQRTANGRKVFLSHQWALPPSLLEVMGAVTEWGADGWAVQVEPRRVQDNGIHGFEVVFASAAGEREIRMQPVHLLDGDGGTPGSFVGYDVVDTGYTVGREGELANPVAKGVHPARALQTVLAQAPGTDGFVPAPVQRDNRRRQRLGAGTVDPQAPEQLTTRGGGGR